MDWRQLLEFLLPGILEFLEVGPPLASGTPRTEAEKMTAVVSLSQHALALAGIPLPNYEQLGAFVQSTVDKMKGEGKLGGFGQGNQLCVDPPKVGELDQPS